MVVAGAASASSDQQQKFIQDMADAKQSHGSTDEPLGFSLETMAVVGGIVVFVVVFGTLIASLSK
jgi:hypothetical protein